MKTENKIDEKIQEIYNDVLREISNIELNAVRNDRHPNGWSYIRIYPDGRLVAGLEPSQCVPESEYFGKSPHPLTVWSTQSNGSFSAPMGEMGVVCYPLEEEEMEKLEKLAQEKFGEKFFELDQQTKNDLAYEFGNYRPDNFSEFGFSKYDDSCGWVDLPDFDPDGEILKKIETWAEENLIVEDKKTTTPNL